ncbi:MAG: 4-alpha-glucanotransferase [Candidatus Velthaea sp.]
MNPVEEHYRDALGVERTVPTRTRETFAALLSASESGEPIVAHAIVVRENGECAFHTLLPASSWTGELTWTLVREDGTSVGATVDLRDAPVTETFEREGVRFDRRKIVLPRLPLGYHRLNVDAQAYGKHDGAFIVVPAAAFAPSQSRSWGIAIQLYTLRSARNWGIGDFGDLRDAVALAADAGASYLGLNPLHAPHRSDPNAASPYAPTSRRFLNWLALDVEALPEAGDPGVRAAIAERTFARRLAQLRATALVDYAGVAQCKDAILRRAFAVFEREPQDPDFAGFVAREGIALERFAIFETLTGRLGRDTARWPEAYRDARTAEVRSFADAERAAVTYAMWLQWRLTQQLSAVAAAGRERGVELYRDLAVGVDASGADVWGDPQAYLPSASVGAPPDVLNPGGQDWGLPPLDPSALTRDGYRTVAELFRANMAEAGALRIDHAMSLTRLFWIPRGAPASDGGYIRYPLEDVLGILALESARARCVVIGEDLGTVPAGFRECMSAARVLSYRILFFERDETGGFIEPERYPPLALAASGTHDLAPFAAWLEGSDIDLRERLAVIGPDAARIERAERQHDRFRLTDTLTRSGDLAPTELDDIAIVTAAHRFLARSHAAIVMMQLDDAIGEHAPVNVPGTSDQYPNWRRKLGADLATIARDPRFLRLCAAISAERPVPMRSNA